jgi:hypothetical protein
LLALRRLREPDRRIGCTEAYGSLGLAREHETDHQPVLSLKRQRQRALNSHGCLGIAEVITEPREQHLPARFDAHQIDTKASARDAPMPGDDPSCTNSKAQDTAGSEHVVLASQDTSQLKPVLNQLGINVGCRRWRPCCV